MISQLILLLDDPSDAPLMIEMYEMYHIRLYKYASSLLHNQHDTEDAVQSTWERMARNFTIPKKCFLESHKSFFSYAATIVKNLAIDETKRRKKIVEFPENWDAPAPDNTEAQSAEQMMRDMIQAMPKDMQRVLSMQFSGFSFKEIGKALGCKEDAARKRFNKAYDALKKRIDDAGY